MRLIDVDKIHPDVLSKKGLCITQNQLANALTIDAVPVSVMEDIKSEINELSELDHAEPTYEDCKRDVLEIINKRTSGAKMQEVEDK